MEWGLSTSATTRTSPSPARLEAVRSFAELAIESGAPRLVLLSGRGEPENERGEQAVRETGAELTIVRSTWFMQNFSEDYMHQHVLSGEIRLPAGDLPTPFVDADDIADVAVAALTDDRHIGKLYELTGPRSLTFAEAAAEIAEAADREVRYVPVSFEEHATELTEHGVPTEVIELFNYLFSEVVDGRNAGHHRRRASRPRPRREELRGLRPKRGRHRRLDAERHTGEPEPRRSPVAMSGPAEAAAIVTALGCGLVAGVFFAFSTFVMGALRRLPPAQGIAAMQSINVVVITPAFMTALFGTAIACLGLIVWAVISPGEWPVAAVVAGAALYLVGAIGTTMAGNVPMNDRLADLNPGDAEAAVYWDEYVTRWTAWNHLRTAAALAAAAVLTVAITL